MHHLPHCRTETSPRLSSCLRSCGVVTVALCAQGPFFKEGLAPMLPLPSLPKHFDVFLPEDTTSLSAKRTMPWVRTVRMRVMQMLWKLCFGPPQCMCCTLHACTYRFQVLVILCAKRAMNATRVEHGPHMHPTTSVRLHLQLPNAAANELIFRYVACAGGHQP
jgi:hypothetical protein